MYWLGKPTETISLSKDTWVVLSPTAFKANISELALRVRERKASNYFFLFQFFTDSITARKEFNPPLLTTQRKETIVSKSLESTSWHIAKVNPPIIITFSNILLRIRVLISGADTPVSGKASRSIVASATREHGVLRWDTSRWQVVRHNDSPNPPTPASQARSSCAAAQTRGARSQNTTTPFQNSKQTGVSLKRRSIKKPSRAATNLKDKQSVAR